MSNPDEAIERGTYKISVAPVRFTARLPQADSPTARLERPLPTELE